MFRTADDNVPVQPKHVFFKLKQQHCSEVSVKILHVPKEMDKQSKPRYIPSAGICFWSKVPPCHRHTATLFACVTYLQHTFSMALLQVEEKVYELKQRLKQVSQAWDSQTMGFLTHLDHVFMGLPRRTLIGQTSFRWASGRIPAGQVCRKEVELYMPHAFWQ